MAHAFKTIPAKPTFGSANPLIYGRDYLDIKKARVIQREFLMKKYKNYDDYYLSSRYHYRNLFNKYNLVYNLYSKENLQNVATVGSMVNSSDPETVKQINPSLVPFYQFYNIDYQGQLFGNSQCGELNYVNYMQLDLLAKNC